MLSPQLYRAPAFGALRAVEGTGVTASVLIGLVAAADVVEQFGVHTGGATTVLAIGAAIAFLVWLQRARGNGELVHGPSAFRLSRDWTIWGWFVPVVGFWFPHRVVADVHRAETRRSGVVVHWWWIAYLGQQVAHLVAELNRYAHPLTEVARGVSAALYAIAAVLIIVVVHRISTAQSALIAERWEPAQV